MMQNLETAVPATSGLSTVDLVFNREWFTRDRIMGLRAAFQRAQPFPHLVIDHLFADDLLERIAGEFDRIGFGDWVRYDTPDELKFGTRPAAALGPAAQAYFDAVHRAAFLSFLTEVTSIAGLIPDPSLKGGGLHEVPVGGRFGVHVDFAKHPVTMLDNRLVLITYLNKGWQPAWGGALQLWSSTQNRCVRAVEPIFGRTILFAHSADSLHGHPEPIAAPIGRTRRSIAAYFYSNGGSDDVGEGQGSTRFHSPVLYGRWGRTLLAVKYLTPPALVQLAKWLKRSLARR